MSDRLEKFPAIPDPQAEIRALTKTVRALKAVVEMLTGVRSTAGLRAVTTNEAIAATILPFKVPGYERSSLPPAAENKRGLVFVVDGAGALRVGYSDGFNWRYLQDGGTIADSGLRDGGGDQSGADNSGGQ